MSFGRVTQNKMVSSQPEKDCSRYRDVALSALTGPAAAISTIIKKVAKKIKDETK
jgi:glyceraldehyde-3-phosphate dehydrogenase/erythrose-4-phosphate dehydrogenase